jgi:hypothetical protein
MGRHVTKSIYVPGDPKGKGIVALALDPADPAQKSVLDVISTLPSAELRNLLGIESWQSLEAMCAGGRAKSEVMRERLLSIAERMPAMLTEAAREGIRATPAGTEDSPARVKKHLTEFVRHQIAGAWRVLDPFAGTCNFPLAAVALPRELRLQRRRSKRAWYCESDPVARLWAQLKIDIATRSIETRDRLDAQLDELAGMLPSLVWHAAQEGSAAAGPRIVAMEAALDALIGERRGTPGEARLETALPPNLRATLVAARRVADEMLAESPLLGRCLELSIAAAGARAARTAMRSSSARAEVEMYGFEDHVAAALGDLKMTWLARVDPASAPTLLCEDARDLAQFPDLGINVVLTSLPAFSVTDVVDPGKRVEHWMLRLADPSGRGRGLGSGARSKLEMLYGRPGTTAPARDSRSLSAAELRAFMDEGALPGASPHFRGPRARWKTLRMTLEDLGWGSSSVDDDAMAARAGTALLRYVATIADVFGAIFEGREKAGGVALIEVPSSQVRDLEIDLPAIVDDYLTSLALEPIFDRRRAPRIVAKSVLASGRTGHTRDLRTELLAYRF